MFILIPHWRMYVTVISNFINFCHIVERIIFPTLWEAIRLCRVLYIVFWIPTLDLFHHVKGPLELVFNLHLCSKRKVHGCIATLTVFPCLWISWIDRFNTYWMTKASGAHCFIFLLHSLIHFWKLSVRHWLIIREFSVCLLDSHTHGIRYTLR